VQLLGSLPKIGAEVLVIEVGPDGTLSSRRGRLLCESWGPRVPLGSSDEPGGAGTGADQRGDQG
jgi:hypothetical protein